MKKIVVFIFGGDVFGMNVCVRVVVCIIFWCGYEVVGICRGYQGMIEGDFWEMEVYFVSNIIQLGGIIFCLACSQDFCMVEGWAKVYVNLCVNDIDGIVVIGGDGSFIGVCIFMEEYFDIYMVGCLGIIDNDLYGMDYIIGYDMAINIVMNVIDNIKDMANVYDCLFFVEVMGWDVGFIVMNVGLVMGVEVVLVLESKIDVCNLIDIFNSNYSNKKNFSIVVVVEGDESGGVFKFVEEVKKYCFYEIKVIIFGYL